MIDITPLENQLGEEIKTAVLAEFPTAFITDEYVPSPTDFPCLSIVIVGNTVRSTASTSDEIENYADLSIEVNGYSNRTNGKKQECDKLMAIVDGVLARRNFNRTMLQPIPNLADATIYRKTGRYTVTVGRDLKLYRR